MKKEKHLENKATLKMTEGKIKEHLKIRQTLLAQVYADTFNPLGFIDQLKAHNGIVHWEELECVGFNPEISRLEAVVCIKQSAGYSGNLCANGSTEYIRFFIDWKDGSGFQDVGLTSFKAYDISDVPAGPQHPLKHMVFLDLDANQYQKCCKTEVLPEVRAVLSWNQIPSLNPNDMPIYGNRRDANIQLDPKWSLQCLLGSLELSEINTNVFEKIDLNKELAQKLPSPVPISALQEKYKKAKVPDHRMVYQVVQPLLKPDQKISQAIQQADFSSLYDLKIDLSAIIKQLQNENANTSYEELVCAGLNTATDTLGAVIHVKKPIGYSGDLCQSGSKEYVAFWADWNNDGSFDEYLGTADVNVHDIEDVPAEGLFYGVFLNVNLTDKIKACIDPNIIRIRAVLSWGTPPSTTDSNDLNYWGNRLDEVVRIRHGQGGTGLLDLIYSVANVPVENIDPTTHLAYPSSGMLNPNNCSQAPMDRPMGGLVSIRGRIYNSGAPGAVHYQVQVAPAGTGNWIPATNTATYRLAHPNPADPLFPLEIKTINSADGWFPYQENWNTSPPILEQGALLANWNTGSINGIYDIRLAYTTDYPGLNPANILYSDVMTVVIDNDDFTVNPNAGSVVNGSYDLDIVIDGGDCHSYAQGEVINGHLRARDKHFWKWALELQPSTHSHGLQANPQCKTYASLIDQGPGNGAWQLSTTQGANSLDPCGYTLTLRAWDRAILNSNGAVMHSGSKAVGFSIHP